MVIEFRKVFVIEATAGRMHPTPHRHAVTSVHRKSTSAAHGGEKVCTGPSYFLRICPEGCSGVLAEVFAPYVVRFRTMDPNASTTPSSDASRMTFLRPVRGLKFSEKNMRVVLCPVKVKLYLCPRLTKITHSFALSPLRNTCSSLPPFKPLYDYHQRPDTQCLSAPVKRSRSMAAARLRGRLFSSHTACHSRPHCHQRIARGVDQNG